MKFTGQKIVLVCILSAFSIVSADIVFENVDRYAFVYDSCLSDYFVFFQRNESIMYAINYSPFFEIELFDPLPPFRPNLLLVNQTLLDAAINIRTNEIFVLTNEILCVYNYNLQLINSTSNQDGLLKIEYDHFGHRFTLTDPTVIDVWPNGTNQWSVSTPGSIKTSKRYGSIVYEPAVLEEGRLIKAQSKGQSWTHQLPRIVSGKVHVVDRNLFNITSLSNQTLEIYTFPAVIGAARHEFCDDPDDVFLTCEPCAFIGNISIARGFTFVTVETTIPYLNVKANETIYLGSNINTNVTILEGTVILGQENITIACTVCKYETATVWYQPETLDQPQARCIEKTSIGLIFSLCQEESSHQDSAEPSPILLAGLIVSILLAIIIGTALFLYFNKKTRKILFPFKNRSED